jgi:acetolactate synthase-1/3 small subunit
MSHVAGLFARRAFNLEGILCMPIGDGTRSRMWLRVEEDRRLPQVTKQLERLQDVLSLRIHGAEHEAFGAVRAFFRE